VSDSVNKWREACRVRFAEKCDLLTDNSCCKTEVWACEAASEDDGCTEPVGGRYLIG
jgi:hypothetical protein